MEKKNITLYKYFDTYGFSYYWGPRRWGNNNPKWLRVIAKILWKIFHKKVSFKF